MKKKVLALLLATAMIATFAGCSEKTWIYNLCYSKRMLRESKRYRRNKNYCCIKCGGCDRFDIVI